MESSEDHSIAQPMEIDDDETESDEVPEDDPIFLYQRFLPDTPSAHPQPRQEACRDTSAALSSWMESAARLQTRFEETRQLLRDKNAVITKAERLEKQALAARDRALAEMEKLKIQNTELRQQLEAAGAPGSSHQELVRLFFENTELKKKLDHANNKVQASERDAGFAREQYQFASTATYEMRKELDGVQAANTELQRKADARAIKLREMAMANAATARDAEIEELNIRLKEREDRIARLEQREVYGLKRGSVPRRVGSPALSRGSSPGLAALRRGEV